MSTEMQSENITKLNSMRGNPQIWRLAQYIYERIIPPWEGIDWCSWYECAQSYRDHMYDKAAELLKKIHNNEFTGSDNHGD